MPTYDYRCTECHHVFEESQSINAQPLKKCPKCQKETLKRGPGGGIGLSFKGTGFYITDYPKNDGGPSKEPPTSGGCGCGKNSCDK